MTNRSRGRARDLPGTPAWHASAYRDILVRLAGGGGSAIFIDDSGLPPKSHAPTPLDAERKTWAAVLVPQDRIRFVFAALRRLTATLKRQFGLDEFHAVNVYSGKSSLRGVDIALRMGIFEAMADIVEEFNLPVVVQSFDARASKDLAERFEIPGKLGPFKISRPEQTAFLFLLYRLHKALVEPTPIGPWEVFVDQGLYGDGHILTIPGFTYVRNGEVRFTRSDQVVPIQLADFAAFVVNRSTHVIGEGKSLSFADRLLAQILHDIADHFVNIETKSIPDMDDFVTYRDELIEKIRAPHPFP